MSSTIGKNIKVSVFGQSHSYAIGVTVDGLPAGRQVNLEKLQAFLERRAPGRNLQSTQRKEADHIEVLSGLVEGRTCGAPFAALIHNKDTRSGDYKEMLDIPRPSHADYVAHVKYGGAQDVAGGGHFSGRLTAPICIAGGILLQLLEEEGITIRARIKSIAGSTNEEEFTDLIEAARMDCDSVGGIIECVITGMPVGVGEPMFDGVEGRIAQTVFGIPAVKAIEFGNGFEAASLRGSENNDPFTMEGERVVTTSNRHGGILGGITSGMPIVFRVAMKPTPSIAKEQDSISLTRKENTKLQIKGRHDPCIVPRAVPCMEAAAAIALYDLLLYYKKEGK